MPPVDFEGQPGADALLREFSAAADEACADQLLWRLLTEHADPIISRVVRTKLFNQIEAQDNGDLRNQVHLLLLGRLKKLREHGDGFPITNFEAYVAATARNACHAYVSLKHQARW